MSALPQKTKIVEISFDSMIFVRIPILNFDATL